ncbi:MAG TPA: hypothetical protein VKZ76_08650 [Edaphocola sp.]|nr:hypothetical protein [Edaphocola sp.]
MEALKQVQQFQHSFIQAPKEAQTIPFFPYYDLVVAALSEFDNSIIPYSVMLEIAQQEVELLLIAKANNPNKLHIEPLVQRNVRLAVLNKMQRMMA